MELDNIIRKYALQNAIKFKGKANAGSLIGKIFAEDPEYKKQAKEISSKIQEILKSVNVMTVEDQTKELQILAPELLEDKPKEKKEGLKPLQNAEEGKVVMRLAPSPSGPLHIGHSYVGSLNSEYVKMYGGKFYVRIEDTNSSNIYEPAYDMIREDMDWLTDNSVTEYIIQSDRVDLYYDYALKLFDKEKLYVCTCDAEEARELIKKSEACPCRNLAKEEQLIRWKKMFSEYQQGEAVVKFKSDLTHKNPAMRDFPLFRINEEEHPRVGKKYRVWPLMNMSVAIDDMELGMTHTLRGKDHADNAKRQEMIHEVLEHKTPISISVGRINFEGLELSTTKTKERIKSGEFEGWDDIRLATLLALKKRGYQANALRKYAVSVGASKNDKTVAVEEFFKTINAFNKEIIDPIAHRHYFVSNPREIEIKNAPEVKVEMDLHPENKKGGRNFSTKNKFFISEEDFNNICEGEIIRLINCLNFKKENNELVFVSKDVEDFKNSTNKGQAIHWVIDDNKQNVMVRLQDNSIIKGYAEKYVQEVKENQIVQFERFGFCRCDNITPEKTEFWFAHK